MEVIEIFHKLKSLEDEFRTLPSLDDRVSLAKTLQAATTYALDADVYKCNLAEIYENDPRIMKLAVNPGMYRATVIEKVTRDMVRYLRQPVRMDVHTVPLSRLGEHFKNTIPHTILAPLIGTVFTE